MKDMKPSTISKSVPRKADQIAAAVKAAPERVHDPECPYDPNEPAAVEAFWKKATVRRPGQQGPDEKAKKA